MEVVNDSGCHNNDLSLDLAMSYIDNSKCKCYIMINILTHRYYIKAFTSVYTETHYTPFSCHFFQL